MRIRHAWGIIAGGIILISTACASSGRPQPEPPRFTGVLYCNEHPGVWSMSSQHIWGEKRRACGRVHTDPEGWIRGFARLNRDTGDLNFAIELDTDVIHAGPCGVLDIHLIGADGKHLYTLAASRETAPCRGGRKTRAEASVVEVTRSVPLEIASRTAEIDVDAVYVKHHFAPAGIDLKKLLDIATLVYTVIVANPSGG